MRNRLSVVLFLGLAATAAAQPAPEAEDAALRHARQLLKSTPLIDGHNDLPREIFDYPKAPGDVDAYDLRTRRPGETDLPRMRQGGMGGQFWSVWVPGEIKVGYAHRMLQQIDIARRMIARYPDTLALALTADDIEREFKRGRIPSLLGMEGGYAIENSLALLRDYYLLGVRYMILTHNVTHEWGDAARDEARHNGLTPFGKEVVREMNRLGMLVDLSHTSAKVMSDALDVTEAPVIFSHASARALVSHPRNVPDEILTRVAKNHGVVMVTFIPSYVSGEVARWIADLDAQLKKARSPEEAQRILKDYVAAHAPVPHATLAQVADHIEHVRKVAGVDCVGIGSDFWGGTAGGMPEQPVEQALAVIGMPVGLEDTSKYPYLIAELIRRGWPDADLKKVAGLNVIRALRDAEGVSRRLQQTRPPSTATFEQLDGVHGK
jgi:membrane dipeptidase